MAAASAQKIEGSFKRCLKPGMNRPHDVICHQGQYIVTDTFYNRIIALNPADSSSEVLCEKKQGSLSSNIRPYGIVALSDSKQDFLFTDTANRCILRYVDDSCRIWAEAKLPQKGRPTGITVDSEGQVYVADCENRCIWVLDEHGRYSSSFGSKNLQSPWFLAFNSQGDLFVTDNHGSIKVFTKDGHFVKKLEVRSENRSWTCRGIAIDQYDNIFVTARTTGSVGLLSREMIVVFDANHKVVSSFGGLMKFHFARGVCCDYENNHLVVVDGEWHRLQLYHLYDQQSPGYHTSSKATDQSTSAELSKDGRGDHEDCESSVHEEFDISSYALSLFEEGDDNNDDPETCNDDYDYDYSHLELFQAENYNIASPYLHSETGD